jgi:hypothetical protein
MTIEEEVRIQESESRRDAQTRVLGAGKTRYRCAIHQSHRIQHEFWLLTPEFCFNNKFMESKNA